MLRIWKTIFSGLGHSALFLSKGITMITFIGISLEFKGLQAENAIKTLSRPHFMRMLNVLSVRHQGMITRWNARLLAQNLRIELGKVYELLRFGVDAGLIEEEKAKVPTQQGNRRKSKVFIIADSVFDIRFLSAGTQYLNIRIDKNTSIRTLESIRNLFTILESKPFRISADTIRSTHTYFTLKKLQEEWKRNNLPNLRAAWYSQVIQPMQDLQKEIHPLERTGRPVMESLVLRGEGRNRRPPLYFRFRYAFVRIQFKNDDLPAPYATDENGIVYFDESGWDIFP
ncbi:MAG: hypothetical protein D6732_02340 [Methanobacteriota archaeon]|nr:MAG: hypothetical protein D6732_02340 [Euryarchaeota archaeon]